MPTVPFRALGEARELFGTFDLDAVYGQQESDEEEVLEYEDVPDELVCFICVH